MAPASPTPSPLRAARLERGLRLADVAADAHCAVALVSMVEKGYLAGTGVRQRMAAAVGGTLERFWPAA